MKSPISLPRIAVIATTIMVLAQVSGCGQRGPLYLPEKPQTTPTIPESSVIPTPLPESINDADAPLK